MDESKREMTFDEMAPGVLEEAEQWITSVNDGRLPSMEATFSLVAVLRTCVRRAQDEVTALRAAQKPNIPEIKLAGGDEYIFDVDKAKKATLQLREAIDATCDSAQRLRALFDKPIGDKHLDGELLQTLIEEGQLAVNGARRIAGLPPIAELDRAGFVTGASDGPNEKNKEVAP